MTNRVGKKIEEKYKVLDQISHILLRPQIYLGSTQLTSSVKWILEDNKFVQKNVNYIPAFLKLFDELITNSVDESKRNARLNRIDIIIDRDSNRISVKDNGGIEVVIHKEQKKYVPEVIFGTLMSGSNYDDDDERNWVGVNGLGCKLTNIFSREFIISTCDGKNSFKQVFSNNMRDRSKPVIRKLTRNSTEISFVPDFDRFGLQGIDDDHFKVIEKRVYDIAACNHDIKIYFNNKLINFKSFEDYIKYYTDAYFYETKKDKSWSIGISLSNNGFQHVSFVNSSETYDGGTHVDYVMFQIVNELRDFFAKKYKVDVKPSELKNHIFLFLDSTVINPSFSSQTKEKLITEIKDFGVKFDISNKLIQSILKSEIVDSVLDWIQQKKLAEESKLQRDINRKLSKIKVEKLIDAKGRDRWKCSLGIFEGDSASSAFRKYRDPQLQGAFSLRGKILNVSDISNQKLVQNEELVNLMASIGLKLGQKIDIRDLRYGRILFFVDADFDGNSIAGLLINFFYKYWPDLFDRRMVYKVETPILVANPKSKNKKKILFYTQSEYNEWAEKNIIDQWEIKYKKGLASLVDDEYKNMITNPRLTMIKKDDISSDSLDIWFGKNSDLRKLQLLK